MNGSRLLSTISFALQKEKTENIQGRLQGLSNSLGNLSSAPNNTNHQTETSNSLITLEQALKKSEDSLTPSQKNRLLEIKAFLYFSTSLVDEIKSSVAQNAMTPSVTLQLVNQRLNERQAYFDALTTLNNQLPNVGVEVQNLTPGEAEIGILLPRGLFRNELDGLHKELRILNQILRTFYEIANVSPQPIEVHEISTTDPIFFLGIDVTVLVHLGHALKWCVDTIKAIGELKQFIDRAKALDIDPKKTAIFEDEIEDRVKKRLESKVEAMMNEYQGEAARKHELQNSLNIALEQILQRVERGMIVEIRLIAPPKPQEEDSEAMRKQHAFTEASAIAKELEFPQIQGQPALQLTSAEDQVGPDVRPISPESPSDSA